MSTKTKVTKAVIPVAGYGTRFLPFTKAMPKEMLPIVDKPTIQFIVEEAMKSGITDILFITASHSNKRAIEDHFDYSYSLTRILKEKNKLDSLQIVEDVSNLGNFHYIRQKEAKGLGHAICCAKSFVGNEPFAVLLGDDIVVGEDPAINQLLTAFEEKQTSIIGVQKVKDEELEQYGVIACDGDGPLCKMHDFVEKPKISEAPSNYAVLGRYVLTPKIFDYLETQEKGAGDEIQLTDAVKRLMDVESVYACQFSGKRYDIGSKIGFLKATVDFALERDDIKDEFLKFLQEKGKL